MVAATGPSLTPEVAEAVRGLPTIAVNDAYRLLPWADVLYACDLVWWQTHNGCPVFKGARWSSQGFIGRVKHNDKSAIADRYDLNLIEGRDELGFSLDPEIIHYGSNSGFQGVNLAVLFGACRIILVGFDMRIVGAQRHFFGDHPLPLRNHGNYQNFVRAFDHAAKRLPKEIEILNATPNSALTSFPKVDLHDALEPAPLDHIAFGHVAFAARPRSGQAAPGGR